MALDQHFNHFVRMVIKELLEMEDVILVVVLIKEIEDSLIQVSLDSMIDLEKKLRKRYV